MSPQSSASLEQGLFRLQSPLLPLVHIVQWLYLSGPFDRVADLLSELNEPIEMEQVSYQNPAALLTEYSGELGHLERLKRAGGEQEYSLFSEDGTPLDALEAIGQWTRHLILVRELETINSLLCAPQGCTLCCTGPTREQQQLFFEIPLLPEETALFELQRFDSEASRAASPRGEQVLYSEGRPFYEGEPALFHWQKGWSLILPRSRNCPHLNHSGACRIYPRRPEVCRRPQIFPYLLERTATLDEGRQKAYTLRNKLLAVWDCPYVREFKEKIATYAELCGLEPVFRENKS